MKAQLIDAGYAAGWRLVRSLPQRAAAGLFRAGADRAVARRGPGVQRLAQNLSHVVGGPVAEDLLRDAMRSYARYWLEAFRLPGMSPAQLRECFHLDGLKHLVKAHEDGTGAIVALPHAGNWDAAGAMVTASGLPLTTVVERLRPEALFRRFVAFREGLGMKIIPHSGGGPPLDELIRALRAGHIVPLLADRDLSRRGVEVNFFGGKTKMPAGPALLAIRTGAPLFVVNMWYQPEVPCGQAVGPLAVPAPEVGPLDVRVRELTQRVADELARGIAAHPRDWHMLQKMWLGKPSGAEPEGA